MKHSFLFILCSIFLASCTTSTTSSLITSQSTNEIKREYTNEYYQNPLKFYKQDGSEYTVVVADPDVYKDEESGYFYMYCTNTYVEKGKDGMMFDKGPIFRSKNLTDWTWVASAFDGDGATNATSWGDPEAGVWAPTVIKVGNRYNYYYSLSLWGDPNPGIGVATAPTPYGPFTHYGKLVTQDMTGVRNGIDPFVFYDNDELYLVWGSFFGIAAIQLTDDGTELFYGQENAKDHVYYLIDDNTTDGMDVDINYEGSYLLRHNNKIYFFGSSGTCLNGINSTYTVKTGVCDVFLEKFKDHNGNLLSEEPYGDVALAPSEEVAGTGHNCIVEDYAGEYWMLYHGFDINGPKSDERILFMDKILWDENDMPYIKNKAASVRQNNLGPTIVDF